MRWLECDDGMFVVQVMSVIDIVISDRHFCQEIKVFWVLFPKTMRRVNCIHENRRPTFNSILQRMQDLVPRRMLEI